MPERTTTILSLGLNRILKNKNKLIVFVMELREIVLKLVGRIEPRGETNTDNERFENLQTLCKLVNDLVIDIDDMAYRNKDSHEYSVKRASDYAQNFLTVTLGITNE